MIAESVHVGRVERAFRRALLMQNCNAQQNKNLVSCALRVYACCTVDVSVVMNTADNSATGLQEIDNGNT